MEPNTPVLTQTELSTVVRKWHRIDWLRVTDVSKELAVSTFRDWEVQHYDTASYSGRPENVKTNVTALSHATALNSRFTAFYIAKLPKKKFL
jgi:hypothetical protein